MTELDIGHVDLVCSYGHISDSSDQALYVLENDKYTLMFFKKDLK